MHTSHSGLEEQLFTWVDWDEIHPFCLKFWHITLKVAVGEFPIGTKFTYAIIDGEDSLLHLYDAKTNFVHTFDISLNVNEKISQKPEDKAFTLNETLSSCIGSLQ